MTLHPRSRRALTAATLATALGAGSAAHAQFIQSQSTTSYPMVVPTAPGWFTLSILTVNDPVSIGATGGYEMVGIPDGMGVYVPEGTPDIRGNPTSFRALVNHELVGTAGTVRAHGATGAFVSQWTIQNNFAVTAGSDLITTVREWNEVTTSYVTNAAFQINRLCSADLPAVSAFSFGSFGTTDRIFMHGEEFATARSATTNPGLSGAAWGTVATGAAAGTTYELPRLGKFAWENALASPSARLNTIVIGMDDSNRSTSPALSNVPSEFYMYVGTKTDSGNAVERAGLTNGSLFAMQVLDTDGTTILQEEGTGANPFGLTQTNSRRVTFVQPLTNAQLETDNGFNLQQESVNQNVTRFQRIEDGAWHPQRENEFYFVTTADNSNNSRLWKVTYDDLNNPTAGGTIELLIDLSTEGGLVGTGEGGSIGIRMMDNVGFTADGRLFIQEDPGGNNRLARVWAFDTNGVDNPLTAIDERLSEVARHDPNQFVDGTNAIASFPTNDEESSGIIDISYLFNDGFTYLLGNTQNHTSFGLGPLQPELVENGQLWVLTNNPGISQFAGVIPEPSTWALLAGLAGLAVAVLRRRR